jgi:transposase
MKTVVKQVVGIDVAQDELVVSVGKMYGDFNCDMSGRSAFNNNVKGFEKLILWLEKLVENGVQLRFVMEVCNIIVKLQCSQPHTNSFS